MSRSSKLPEVSLGPLDDADLEVARGWRNNPMIYTWCRQYEPVSWHRHWEYWKSVDNDPNTKMYGVFARNEGGSIALIGVCGLTSIDWINRRAEFSLYISPAWHGSGYGESALKALCKHGFNVLNLNCIWGESFDSNPAMKMFKRVGFKEEGRRREFYYRDGRYIDAVLFSLLRSEYVG